MLELTSSAGVFSRAVRQLTLLICYQPYITKTYFGLKNPPVKLAKIAIGDGSLDDDRVSEDLPVVRILNALCEACVHLSTHRSP